jgi:hypothetical protein
VLPPESDGAHAGGQHRQGQAEDGWWKDENTDQGNVWSFCAKNINKAKINKFQLN